MLLPAIVLYVIAAILGLWSASLLWRAWHAWRLQRRARRERRQVDIAITSGRRRLGVAIAIVCLPLSGVVFGFGEAIRREVEDLGDDVLSLVVGGGIAILVLMGLSAIYVAFRFDPADGRRRCGKCWYDMSATPGLRCTECGREARNEKALLRTRRAPGLLVITVVIFASAYALYLVPKVRERGWGAAAPTTALIIGLPWWSNEMVFFGPSSLRERLYEDEVWKWQESLLEWRAARVVTRSEDLETIARASRFTDEHSDESYITNVALLKWMRLTCLSEAGGSTGGLTAADFPPASILPPTLDAPTAAAASEIIEKGLANQTAPYAENALQWSRVYVDAAELSLPALITIMKNGAISEEERDAAIWAVAQVADRDEDAWAAIRWAVASGEYEYIRLAAVRALTRVRTRREDVLREYLGAFNDPSGDVASRAAMIYMAAADDPCVELEKLLEVIDKHPAFGHPVLLELVDKCANEQVAARVGELMRDWRVQSQENGANAAGQLGVYGKPLLLLLREFSIYEGQGDFRWKYAQEAIRAIEAALGMKDGETE